MVGSGSYDGVVRVCVLMTALDTFKGGNHLPLFAALPDVSFTILTQRVRAHAGDLPSNVRVERAPDRGGSYYFGTVDRRFASSVLRAFPPHHVFWKQFQVLHLNQTLHPSLLRLRASGVPLLYAVHHPVTADLEAALDESSFLARLLWRARYHALIRWQGNVCRAAPRIMTVSRTVAQRLQEDYRCDARQISIVPNGVDGARFLPPASEQPEFDCIAVGSFLHPRKGFPYLLTVYRALSAEGFAIADVGRRSPAQRAALAQLPGVRIFDTVEQDQIPALLQRSRVLLSTSLYEGFGLSLIEALACGRPAFAFAGGAVAEVLKPIEPQLIIPLRDTNAMVQRVQWWLRRPLSDCTADGRRYRDAVLGRFSLVASAAALRTVYNNLCRA